MLMGLGYRDMADIERFLNPRLSDLSDPFLLPDMEPAARRLQQAIQANESIAVAYRGRELSIAFNPEFLIDPLRNLPNDEVFLELIDEMSPGVVKIQSPFLYVIMPMRVSV